VKLLSSNIVAVFAGSAAGAARIEAHVIADVVPHTKCPVCGGSIVVDIPDSVADAVQERLTEIVRCFVDDESGQ
jgi:hypothetical protein